jgi:hypothetical protein
MSSTFPGTSLAGLGAECDRFLYLFRIPVEVIEK